MWPRHCLSFSALLFFSASIPARAEIILGDSPFKIISSEFPPFTYQDADGQSKGFMSEVLSEVKKELERRGEKKLASVKTEYMPWNRAYILSTEHKNVLLYPVATVPKEREELFDWLGPRMKRAIWIYGLKDDLAKFRIDTKEDLSGKIVGATRGYSWIKNLQAVGAKVDETTDDRILILKLLGRRMPYMAIDEDVKKETLRLMAKEDQQFANIDARLEKVFLLCDKGSRTFGLSKKSNPELKKVLAESFKTLQTNGVLKKIEKNYPEIEFIDGKENARSPAGRRRRTR